MPLDGVLDVHWLKYIRVTENDSAGPYESRRSPRIVVEERNVKGRGSLASVIRGCPGVDQRRGDFASPTEDGEEQSRLPLVILLLEVERFGSPVLQEQVDEFEITDSDRESQNRMARDRVDSIDLCPRLQENARDLFPASKDRHHERRLPSVRFDVNGSTGTEQSRQNIFVIVLNGGRHAAALPHGRRVDNQQRLTLVHVTSDGGSAE